MKTIFLCCCDPAALPPDQRRKKALAPANVATNTSFDELKQALEIARPAFHRPSAAPPLEAL